MARTPGDRALVGTVFHKVSQKYTLQKGKYA